MKYPLTYTELVDISAGNESLKQILRETFRFPCDTPETSRLELRLQAIQRIDDIVMFHRFAMFTHTQSNEVVTPVFKKFNEHYNLMFDEIRHNPGKVASARMAFPNFAAVEQLRQVECIANESLVINLWATVEQIATRCITMILNSACGKRAPHKWKDIESNYAELNINLKNSASYPVINELRVLNNKIKHSYVVDEELSSFIFFKEHANKTIDSIPLRVFDYALSAYNFVCFVTNRSGESEYYPENEEDDED